MKEELISFEVAKLAKEKGFNIPVIYGYVSEDCQEPYAKCFENTHCYNVRGNFSAPTQALLQRWLREVKGIHVEATFDSFHKVYYIQLYLKDNHTFHGEDDRIFKTYEEALEKGLQEGLKMI